LSGLKVSLLFGNGGAQKNKAAQNWTPFFLHLCFTELLPSYMRKDQSSLYTHSRFVALLSHLDRPPPPRTHTNNKKKTRAIRLEQQRKEKSSRSGVGADKTLGPHIVGLKSYLIGKQFKINNPAAAESVNWRCEHQVCSAD
jgi:hypothetical protein